MESKTSSTGSVVVSTKNPQLPPKVTTSPACGDSELLTLATWSAKTPQQSLTTHLLYD